MSVKYLGSDWTCDACKAVTHSDDTGKPKTFAPVYFSKSYRPQQGEAHLRRFYVCDVCWPRYDEFPAEERKSSLVKKMLDLLKGSTP